MAYTTINKSSDYFNTKLYTGTGSELAVSSVGFQPDWVWLKDRGAAASHILTDAVRTATKVLKSNTTGAESTNAQALKSFDSDGFTLGTTSDINTSSNTYVSWNWKANGQGSSNTDGSINTTYTSVNNTAGFSISSYTGTGANATIGTGLTSKPACVIIKNLTDASTEWMIGHQGLATNAFSSNKYIHFNTATTATNASSWNSIEPTSNGIVSLGNGSYLNGSGKNYICYAFTEKQGYSKFGSYEGNGSTDGSFIFTGFKPAFVMMKGIDSGGSDNWNLCDNKRVGYNAANWRLYPNATAGENSTSLVDILSNGFKLRVSSTDVNASAKTYIFMAFAEAPLVGSNNVPANAR